MNELLGVTEVLLWASLLASASLAVAGAIWVVLLRRDRTQAAAMPEPVLSQVAVPFVRTTDGLHFDQHAIGTRAIHEQLLKLGVLVNPSGIEHEPLVARNPFRPSYRPWSTVLGDGVIQEPHAGAPLPLPKLVIYPADREGKLILIGYDPNEDTFTELADFVEDLSPEGGLFGGLRVTASEAPAATDLAPKLSAQERRVMALYGGGEPVKAVAHQLGISEETAKSYLKRIREKYRVAGIDVETKVALRRRAIQDGLLMQDGSRDSF